MSQALAIATIVAGAGYVLILPGLALSFAFFRRGAIDAIERVALSFALSIAVVPLVVFYTNLAGLKISQVSVVAQIAGIIVVALLVAWTRGAFRSAPKAEALAPAAPPPPAAPPRPKRPIRRM